MWNTIRTKLREKLQAQQHEIRGLKERVESLERTLEISKAAAIDQQDASGESDQILEMAMLDREMAEEERDQVKNQQVELLSRIEELELELDILRDQHDRSSGSIEGHDATDSKVLEVQNERFREALIRLKEITNEQERTIASVNIESDKAAHEVESLRSQLVESTRQIEDLERLVDDLKVQVSISVGAEEMLENLSIRNLALGEQLEACRMEIADLESLKELNDELEEVHNQSQKELSDELGLRDALIAEQTSRLVNQEDSISEYAMTIERFRVLVDNLQHDIAEKSSTNTSAASEKVESLKELHQLMAENTSLKSQQRKSGNRALTIELKQLETISAIEHLSILQEYLPLNYEQDRDSVEAYLTTKRLTSLTKILHNDLLTTMTGRSTQEQPLNLKICQMLLLLGLRMNSLSRMIITATGQEFSEQKGLLSKLSPIAAQLKSFVSSVEQQDSTELKLYHNLTAAIEIADQLETEYFTTKLPSCHLELVLWSVSAHINHSINMLDHLKQYLERFNPETEAADSSINLLDELRTFYEKSSGLSLAHTGEMYVEIDLQCKAPTTKDRNSEIDLMSALLKYSQLLAERIHLLLNNVNNSHQDGAATYFSNDWVDQHANIRQVFDDIRPIWQSLQVFLDARAGQRSDSIVSPWKIRGAEIKSMENTDKETVKQLIRSQQDICELATQLQHKEKDLAEEKMKTQALDRRLVEYARTADTIKTFEANAQRFDLDKRAYEEAIEELTDEIELLQEKAVSKDRLAITNTITERTYSDEVTESELRLLNNTINHLNKKLATYKNDSSSDNLKFLSKPLLEITKVKPALGKKFVRAIHSFYGNLEIVDFSKTPPAALQWTPRREACGSIHYLQEQEYAELLGMKRQMMAA